MNAPGAAEPEYPVRSTAELAYTTIRRPEDGERAAGAVDGDGVRGFGAAEIGPAHLARNGVCEDSFGLWADPSSPWLILVIADGVSQARDSDIASALATAATVNRLVSFARGILPEETLDWGAVAPDVVGDVVARIQPAEVERAATTVTRSPGSMRKNSPPATTLAFALVRRVSDGIDVYWATVGDSEVVLVGPGIGLSWVSGTDTPPGRTRSNSTAALPGSADALQVGSASLGADVVVALATDGCAGAMRQEPDYFVERLVAARDGDLLEHFAIAVGFDMLQMYDDRTLVAGWATPGRSQ